MSKQDDFLHAINNGGLDEESKMAFVYLHDDIEVIKMICESRFGEWDKDLVLELLKIYRTYYSE